ncbi:MAG: DUF427 domain-containing protein [Nitrospinota bacterium]
MDSWHEEEDEIFVHARDPYKRVDALGSSRHIRVLLGGETIAESRSPHLLFETGLPARYYLPEEDVRMDLLVRSERTSGCPYKGKAIYWSAKVNGETFEDVVWSYPDPLPECSKIKGLLAFYPDRVEDIFVDGEAAPKGV